jgi:anthranilate phosphoribosyltransferase
VSALAQDFAAILDGAAHEAEITDFLIRSIAWMDDADALAVGAQALRARMIPVHTPPDAIDVCGTGGDGAHTLNISTAVTFVVAGCGVPVAKHGNRAMSSRSGAADVLEALGVGLIADPVMLTRCLRDAGVAFLFAQNHHPAMRHVAGPRKALGRRTIFNLLGPLSNPGGVKRQLVGVFDPDFAAPMAQALHALGAERAMVVHGEGRLDELALAGANRVATLAAGAISHSTLSAPDLGLLSAPIEALRGGSAQDNAAALRALLAGKNANPAYRAVVCLNAAAALLTAGAAADLQGGLAHAAHSLDSGAALACLNHLIALTQEASRP